MLTVVTAADEKYWRSLQRFLSSIERRDGSMRHRFVAWDLGLSPRTRTKLSDAFPWCSFRRFDFGALPPHFALAAGTYAWKPAIVADMADEFGGLVLWLDSATILKGPLDPLIRIMQELGTVSLQGQSALGAHCDPSVLDALSIPLEVRDRPERIGGVIGFDTDRLDILEIVREWRRLSLEPSLIAPATRTRETHKNEQALLSCLVLTAEFEGRLVLNREEVDISSPQPMRWLTTRNKVPHQAPAWTVPLWGLWHDLYKSLDQTSIALARWRHRRLCGAHRWAKEHFSVYLQSGDHGRPVAVRAPMSSYYADPFLWTRDGVIGLFVEEFRYLENRGRLIAAIVGADLAAGSFRPILPLDVHASFPFLFEHDGRLFMVPETSAGGYVDLFECTQFPFAWRRARRLLYGVDAADSIVFPHQGRWWLLTSVRPTGCNWRHLAIYHTDDPLHGTWLPHPMNGEQLYRERHFSGLRNAGPPWHDGSRLMRVAQTNARYYGDGVTVMEITRLDPEGFAERPVEDVRPGGAQPHHLCRDGALLAWDRRDRVSYARSLTLRGAPEPAAAVLN